MKSLNEKRKSSTFKSNYFQESILFLCISVGLFFYSILQHYKGVKIEWKMSPYLFPTMLSIFLFLLTLSLFIEGKKEAKIINSLDNTVDNTPDKVNINWKAVLFTLCTSWLYLFLISILTFIPVTILYLVVMFYYLGERRKLFIAMTSTISTITIYVLFDVLLNVMLP